MSVQIRASPKRLMPLESGVAEANGSEQTILEFTDVGRVMGYINLENMQVGDQVVIRQYMRVVKGGDFQQYAQEQYDDVQAIPVVYVTPKESDYGIRITLQQTAGFFKQFEYNFMREV